MYSETDLDSAVAAGVLAPEAASALRDHVAAARSAPAVDEEHFRLLTGFNDIFVAIALLLLITALIQIGDALAGFMPGALVALAAWPLAEFFTRRRRMALPSILLLLAFVGGVAAAVLAAGNALVPVASDAARAMVSAFAALAGAGAAFVHWKRFGVPITIAAGAAALVGALVSLVSAAVPGSNALLWPLLFACGLGLFALAMRWDLSDPARRTRRADIAFWLHLAAAPMIAHPLFQLLGVFNGDIGVGTAAVVLGLYLVFAFVALAVDRRALLVSGLAYVLYAMYALIRSSGAVELSSSLTALVIGSALLTLSAFWQPMRRAVVGLLGRTGQRLPPVAMA